MDNLGTWLTREVSCIRWSLSIVDNLGTWLRRSVLYTMETLYCGQLGDLVNEKYLVYGGTSLLWTTWGPG